MVQKLKQSTAVVVHIGPFVDVGDGFTPEVAVTLSGADEAEVLKHAATTTTSISGLTFTAVASCDGWYRLSLGTGETDTLGHLTVIVQDDSVALPVHVRFEVVTANVFDSQYSTDVLDVSVVQWLGTAVPAPGTAGVPSVDVLRWNTAVVAVPTVAGVPEVDLTHMIGVNQSAIDLKDFADDGYDPTTDKVTGVLLVDTTTTNTDMLTAAAVNAEVDTALVDIGLDHLVSAAVVGADITDNSIIASLVSKEATADWDDFVNTTDSLQAIRDQGDSAWITGGGTGLSALSTGVAQAGGATSITLAAGDSATTDIYNGARVLVTGGTAVGQARVITAYNGGTKVATVARAWTTNPVVSDTYEIQAAESNLETIQTDEVSVTDLKDFADAGYDPGTNKVQGVVLVDTTTTNTDVRGTDSAALASVCTEARLAELDAANLPTDIAAVPTVGENADAIWDEARDSHRADGTMGHIMKALAGTDGLVEADAGNSPTQFQSDSGETTNDTFNGSVVVMTDSALQGQARLITDYVGSTGTFTVEPGFTGTPAAGTSWAIVSAGHVNLRTATQTSVDAIETDTGTTLDTKINDIQGAGFATGTDSLEAIRDQGDAAWITATSVAVSAGGITAASFAANAIDAAAIANAAIDAATFAAGAIDAAALATDAVNEIADGLLDRTGAIDTGVTPRQALRLMVAADAGKLSGAATATVTIRNAVADTKNRIIATVDADGNRSAITYDLT